VTCFYAQLIGEKEQRVIHTEFLIFMPTKFATSKALYNKTIDIILEAYKFESVGTFEQYYCYFN
jgi:hypothetical protein